MAASTAQTVGKPGNSPAASVSTERVPSRPAQLPGEPAPPHQAPPPAVPAVPPEASTSPSPTSPGGKVQEATLIRKVPPQYPPLASQAGITGIVRLRMVVGTDGAVKEVTVISGNPLLAKAAVDAVRQWLYRPAVKNGQPTEMVTETAINFTLGGH